MDAILTAVLTRAQRERTAVELDLCPLPSALPYGDGDLTSLLMNLMENALEANARLPEEGERWLLLRMERTDGGLCITCVNAAPAPDGPGTSKADKAAHGFGLPLLRRLAAEYGGEVKLDRTEDCCSVTITLYAEEV